MTFSNGKAIAVTPLAVVPLALLAAAALCDMRWRIIPNWLTAALALGGAAVALTSGWPDALWTLLAAAAVLAGGTVLFALGMLGGGDVKLAAGLALWLPPAAIPPFLILTALAGGALALMIVLWRIAAQIAGGVRPGAALAAALSAPAPYGPAIAAGGAAQIALGG